MKQVRQVVPKLVRSRFLLRLFLQKGILRVSKVYVEKGGVKALLFQFLIIHYLTYNFFKVYFFKTKGKMAEWSNAHAWKACIPQGIGGSNPPLSASLFFIFSAFL